MPASRTLPKPLAGLVFVLGWAIGIVLWSVSSLAPDAQTGAFLVDVGILAVSVGFAAPFLKSTNGLLVALALGLVGIGLFAFGDFLNVAVITYLLRLLAPLLAVLTALYKLLDFRIFA
ncbi:hypothetical protein [Frigoribacterium sp. CG_9.8]|uniref:hypothetical protein n=1 Tax=Frigoribacterium sp. CG_9.8 TaxID=2787733 RepID=UPI0018C95D98|nr:hypothetical protein [Frigoribacterium sp. CG_9.8]MBG6107587.1 hypothetical protein [Frigoribacterium sp. CG_9.8]